MADNLIQNMLVGQNPSVTVLKRTLDAQAARQRAHTQNIANAETPGYQRVKVEFEGLLKEALTGESQTLAHSEAGHIGSESALDNVVPKISREKIPDEITGVNGVNIEEEMAEMAETQIRYLASVELLKRRYQGIREAIRGQ